MIPVNLLTLKRYFKQSVFVTAIFVFAFSLISQTLTKTYADSGFSQSDLQALNEYPNWVPSYGQCGADSLVQTIPTGTLPSYIPQPYNGAFTAGAKAHNVSPSLIAALFSEEHNLGGSETTPNTSLLPTVWANFVKNHPDPNSGWAGSSAGAQGPFQFLTSTFTGLGYESTNINNLLISADAAAKYAQNDGATIDKPVSDWNAFVYSYNHADWYVSAVLQYYAYYAAQPPSSGQANPVTLVVSGCQSSSVDCSTANPATSGLSTIRQTVVCLAQNELALWKSQPGYDSTYPQFTYAQTNFLKYTGGTYEEWCADFVSWLYQQAGYSFDLSSNWKIAYVPNIQSMGQTNNKFHWHPIGDSYSPKPGDLAIFGSNHVNMVVAISNGVISSIGGDLRGISQPDNAFGSKNPASGSRVGTDNNIGVTGYVTPD